MCKMEVNGGAAFFEQNGGTLRFADFSDLPEILAILNYYILHTDTNLNIEQKDKAYIENWFDEHKKKNFPMLVCEREAKLAAYASLSSFRENSGYDRSLEISVYVHPDFLRRGIADALMNLLEKEAAALNIRKLLAVITADNTSSIRLHEKHGFVTEGRLKEAGYKNGRYLDVLFMGKILN